MVKRLRLTPNQRGEALFLLDNGYSVDQAARALQELRHPRRSLEEVQRAYFPSSGHTSIHNLQGKPFDELAKKFFALKTYRSTRVKRMRQFMADPEVAEKRRKRQLESATSPAFREIQRTRMLQRWSNPRYRLRLKKKLSSQEARDVQSERMRKLWGRARFRKKMLRILSRQFRNKSIVAKHREGVKRAWRERKEREASVVAPIEFTSSGKVERAGGGFIEQPRQMVPVHIPDIETTVDLLRELHRGLGQLSPIQRFIAANVLGIEMQHEPETVKQATRLTKAKWNEKFNEAYAYLIKRAALKKLLGE